MPDEVIGSASPLALGPDTPASMATKQGKQTPQEAGIMYIQRDFHLIWGDLPRFIEIHLNGAKLNLVFLTHL